MTDGDQLDPSLEGLVATAICRQVRRSDVLLARERQRWVLYRVARVTNSSPPRWHLVPIDAEPISGDGSAASHHDDHVNYHAIDAFASVQSRYWLVDQERSHDFLQRYIAAERERRGQLALEQQAWSTGPGGVAERLASQAGALRWQAKEMRSSARALDSLASQIDKELRYLRAIAGQKPGETP